MKEPVWVSREECLAAQELLLGRFGGLAGIREPGLLDSALGRPRNLFLYEQPSLCELAAAYAFGIIKNHPFLDGNKRCGFVTAALFLETNGRSFQASEEMVVLQTRALAAGEISEADYAAWIKDSCKSRKKESA